MIMIDGKEVDVGTLVVDNVIIDDYPDFSDAFFCEGMYTDGSPIPDLQLEKLTEENGVFLNNFIHTGHLSH